MPRGFMKSLGLSLLTKEWKCTYENVNGTPRGWNEHLGKAEGVCSLNRSGTCPYLWKSSYGGTSKKNSKIFWRCTAFSLIFLNRLQKLH